MAEEGIRERLERKEESLSPYAIRSIKSRGRLKEEEASSLRTAFQRDRDRIIHSKAFRRLSHKTQVFIAPSGDHYMTRLTHTLLVSQIARTISRALNLNEDLTESIALGHDLGHTPFGHNGEEALNKLLPGGFHHNQQSLRVVDILEREGQGLNLTYEVRDGILKHSKGLMNPFNPDRAGPETLEGQVCRIADLVAYLDHDINDAVRAGIITEDEIPREVVEVLGSRTSERIDSMVTDVVHSSWAAAGMITSKDNIAIGMSPQIKNVVTRLSQFLLERVYRYCSGLEDAIRARKIVKDLFEYYCRYPGKMPPEFLQLAGENVPRGAADYVAGMTDRFATGLHKELFTDDR